MWSFIQFALGLVFGGLAFSSAMATVAWLLPDGTPWRYRLLMFPLSAIMTAFFAAVCYGNLYSVFSG